MTEFLNLVTTRLRPKLVERITAMPVAPAGARHATLNLNSISGGQPLDQRQTPCVPDVCTAVFDRRFLPEEHLEDVRQEFVDLLKQSGLPYEIKDRMIVMPSCTPADATVSRAVSGAIEQVYGKQPEYVASPGTYDQKHFVRIAKVHDCISYGPGILEQAHQPDEHVRVEDLERAAQVMALATLKLLRCL
jgi:succinyl-diaminopimelate desuccinylase